MLGTWQLELSLQITLVVIPVAVYFLVLGLLNSQRRPQLLSGRTDFALLIASLSPLAAVPLLGWLGANLFVVIVVLLASVGIIALLAPRRYEAWAVYNLGLDALSSRVERALSRAGFDACRQGAGWLVDGSSYLRVSAFPILQSVSLTLEDADPARREAWRRFEAELARELGQVETEATPMAVSFVLASTVLIVGPLILLGDRMPEMVRLLSDFVR